MTKVSLHLDIENTLLANIIIRSIRQYGQALISNEHEILEALQKSAEADEKTFSISHSMKYEFVTKKVKDTITTNIKVTGEQSGMIEDVNQLPLFEDNIHGSVTVTNLGSVEPDFDKVRGESE